MKPGDIEHARRVLGDPLPFTESLGMVLRTATPAQRAGVVASLVALVGDCRRFLAEHPGDSRSLAYSLHALLDEAVAKHLEHLEDSDERPSCRAGCSACCYQHVVAWRGEAELLVDYCAEVGIEIDEQRLHVQAAAPSVPEWRQLSYEQRACVFLAVDGRCRVYEHRPAACRKLHVTTDPALCDTQRHPGGAVGRLVTVNAEVVATAGLVMGPAGDLSGLLLEAIEARRAAGATA